MSSMGIGADFEQFSNDYNLGSNAVEILHIFPIVVLVQTVLIALHIVVCCKVQRQP